MYDLYFLNYNDKTVTVEYPILDIFKSITEKLLIFVRAFICMRFFKKVPRGPYLNLCDETECK